MGADTTTVYRWLARYRADGWEDLREGRPAPGPRAPVEAVARFRMEHGYPPSIRDLQKAAGFNSTSVVASGLQACERAGPVVGGGTGVADDRADSSGAGVRLASAGGRASGRRRSASRG
ncbi:MAG: hypothetical protein F4Z07_03410 [Dehalococcoidia bacterium]|nr:hypothetical protein [Dehalococcoidia bacterium]